ncbi:MAG: hypothetical protein KDA24_24095 [Deltaproteobacteria bacterium]|nr:hypothetical protein [Deltaproteobacteria bacterium]
MPASGAVLLFVILRVLVILSAGDILHAGESREAKHTELAWAAATEVLGTSGWGFFDFVLTAGNLHHASFTSVSLVYWLLSLVLGATALAVKLTPLVFWTGGLVAMTALVGRRFGWLAGTALPLCATFATPEMMGWQLSCIGSHSEVVGPLGLMLLAWSACVDAPEEAPDRGLRAALCGGALGYAVGFSYLMWPVVIGLVVLALLPPWRRPSRREWGLLAVGVVVGMWPLWLVLAPDPAGLFGRSITEDPNSTMLAVASGSGRSWFEVRRAFFWALHLEWQDQGIYAPGGSLATSEGGLYLVRSLVVFGPLTLLPAALVVKGRGQRRLGLALGALPFCLLAAIVVTSPFDFVRTPYFMPVWFAGVVWPAVGLGLALSLWRTGDLRRRLLGGGTAAVALAGLVSLVAICAPRIPSMVRLDRTPDVLDHRYGAYWHYGFGSVTADEVEQANDLLDVREAQGLPYGAFGLELGFAMAEHRMELGQDGPWVTPKPDWKALRSRFERWEELSQVFARAYPELWENVEPSITAENMGRALAVRADGDGLLVMKLLAVAEAEGRWPDDLSLPAFWRGFGFGCGRGAWLSAAKQTPGPGPGGVGWIDALPPELAAEARGGWAEAAALGDVPPMGRAPVLRTTLGGPT